LYTYSILGKKIADSASIRNTIRYPCQQAFYQLFWFSTNFGRMVCLPIFYQVLMIFRFFQFCVISDFFGFYQEK